MNKFLIFLFLACAQQKQTVSCDLIQDIFTNKVMYGGGQGRYVGLNLSYTDSIYFFDNSAYFEKCNGMQIVADTSVLNHDRFFEEKIIKSIPTKTIQFIQKQSLLGPNYIDYKKELLGKYRKNCFILKNVDEIGDVTIFHIHEIQTNHHIELFYLLSNDKPVLIRAEIAQE